MGLIKITKMKQFDFAKAKTPLNPDGQEVVTRSGKAVKLTKVIQPILENSNVLFPVTGTIEGIPYCWQQNGTFGIDNKEYDYDLFLKD